jgi:hypothetical protein
MCANSALDVPSPPAFVQTKKQCPMASSEIWSARLKRIRSGVEYVGRRAQDLTDVDSSESSARSDWERSREHFQFCGD